MRHARTIALVTALVTLPLALVGCGGPTVVQETAAPTPDPNVTDPEKPDTPAEPTTGFTLVTDDTGVVSVEVPDTWTEVSGVAQTANSLTYLNVTASPNLAAYNTGWDTPGVSVSAIQDVSIALDDYINGLATSIGPDCDDGQTSPYDDGVYAGSFLYLPNCGGVGTEFLAVVVNDTTGTETLIVTIQMVSDEDKVTNRDQILSTFFAQFPQG